MSKKIKATFSGCLWSLVLVALTSVVGEIVHRYFNPTNLVMLYLLAVVISANLWGRAPSIVAAVVSVLAFDFLFIPPRFTFTVDDTQYFLTFIALLIVGVVISELASKMRERAIEARNREAQTTALFNLSKDLAGTLRLEDAIRVILSHLQKIVGGDVSVQLGEGERARSWNTRGDELADESARESIKLVFSQEGVSRDRAKETGESASHSLALRESDKPLAAYSYVMLNKAASLDGEKKKLLDSMANQAAMAIERIRLLEENREIELLHEKEKLQATLLSSISHDLRTPLVSITGSLSSLLQKKKRLDPQIKQELLETAYEESVRMNRLVGHLLDMARLEAGTLSVQLRPHDIREIIGVSLEELKDKLEHRAIWIEIPRDIESVFADFFLMTKVITNIVDNAAKYSPPETRIELTAKSENGFLKIMVRDHGCGIPPEDLERVVDKFYRVEQGLHVRGTGLGLSICKAIVELHGGRIWIESLENKETTVIVEIPLQRQN